MKYIISNTCKYALAGFLLSLFFQSSSYGQDPCAIPKYHGGGYTTSIYSVIQNFNGTYTIALELENNGCTDPDCKKLNQYSIEADPGTYSNMFVTVLSGNFTYANIDPGPDLGGDPFQGFRINNANGMGNGQAAAFTITYTLTGDLQDQRVLVKTSSNNFMVSFSAADFQSFLDCSYDNIYPYYHPPAGGKLGTSLIGAELTSLYETYQDSGYYESDDIFQVVDSMVMIEIFSLPGQFNNLLSLIQTPTYGLVVEATDQGKKLISGLYPIPNLLLINNLTTLVNYARPAFTGVPSAGIVTSQGDTSLRAYVARNGFNVAGNGIKIGVLSDSYNTQLGNPANDDVLRGDLPGPANPDNPVPVDVLEDFPYGIRTDEGRAMLQIIHDIAPKATLAFRTGFKGAADFADGIRELQQAGCDVIVDDITYYSEPFMEDGYVAQAVEEVIDSGTAYLSAAGNFGNKSYESDFHAYPAPTGISGMAHDFSNGSGDIYQNISLAEGSYIIVLQWDDGGDFYATGTDMDIYLARENGTTLFGFNRVNTGGAAVEVLPFIVSGGSANTNILIVKTSGASNVHLKYIIFKGNATVNEYYSGGSTVFGQANAENSMAVGAVLYTNTPEYGVNPPTVASFSSWGGTAVNGLVRIKPDFCAPNGVNTNVDMGSLNLEGDAFPNFYGTSAAAPHAAGVAALILEARNKFYDDTLSPVQLRGIMQNTAIDMGTPGFDFATGFGLIQADAALSSMANPSPVITGIYYDTTLVPGEEPIPITVTGQYLTEGSVIYFNGELLPSGTTVENDSLLSGTIPTFTNLYPPIQVYNPPMPGTNGTDGGLSNSLYFNTKKTVIISIHDTTKVYGEVMPDFAASYRVESIDGVSSLEGEGFSPAQIARITGIPLETVADDLSNAGLWEIRASLDDPLNPLSAVPATDTLDIHLLDNYNFAVENGLLTITKLDVMIVPRDTTFTYGDTITDLHFNFIYNNDTIDPGNNVIIAPEINDSILNNMRLAYANGSVTTVGMVPATALVNQNGEPLLDSATLVNTSMAISNAASVVFATALVNGTLLSPEALYNATALVNAVSLENSVAMVPATALVNETAVVNSYSSQGTLLFATALVNTSTLVNATALVNATTINANSNSDAIVILGTGDIQILSGDSTGSVDLKSICIITGNTVGQHWIIPGTFISNNFNLSYGLGRLTIIPAEATVTADWKLINAGDTLPEFTATFSGFVNGETDSVVTSLSFTLNPTYNGQAGIYDIIPSATADNYIFTPVSAPLYVNPFGAGLKNIKTNLMCVDILNPPVNGYGYVAHFSYSNDNGAAIFIPIGDDNNITGTGSFSPINQPELFVPGGGTFDVLFNGTKITWTVKSFNGNGHKSSSASSASSTSSKCNKSTEADASEILTKESPGIIAYPNPARNELNINLDAVDGGTFISLTVFDSFGREHSTGMISQDQNTLKVDVSGLSNGLYFIRLNLSYRTEVIKVLKQ